MPLKDVSFYFYSSKFWPVSFFKKNHGAYFKRIPKYMWNVFLVAWEEKKGEREKERCKEGWNAQRTERVMINFDFKGLISTWCSHRGWAQTGGEWCVTGVFLRAQRAADLSEAAAEYILDLKNRKRSSGFIYFMRAASLIFSIAEGE